MRILFLLILLIPLQAFAEAPECPEYANKYQCLQSVEENYKRFLDFIDDEYVPKEEEILIQAALDIKHYEGLACQKTCLN